MAADESLFKALDMFSQGVQEFQLKRSLTRANETVQQIKQSDMAEAQQMEQIRNVANDLTLRLAGQGVNAATIEQVGNAFKPQQPTPFQQSLMLKQYDFAQQDKAREDTQVFTGEQNEKRNEAMIKASEGKARVAAEGKERLPQKAVDELKALDQNTALIKSVMAFTKANASKVRPGLGNMGILGKAYSRTDADYAYLEQKIVSLFNAHRKAVTGAAASDAEIEKLRADFPSLMNSPKQFEARLRSMLDDNLIKRKVSLSSEKANRRDVSGFQEVGSAALDFQPVFEHEFLPQGSALRPSAPAAEPGTPGGGRMSKFLQY